jgi:hypothetical protein
MLFDPQIKGHPYPQINIIGSEFVLIFQPACRDHVWGGVTKSIWAQWRTRMHTRVRFGHGVSFVL